MQVNLLPWRKQTRQIKKVQFTFFSIAFCCVALLGIIFLHILFGMKLHHQNVLNEYLQGEIDKEQSVITTFNEKQKDKVVLEEQLHFIITLYAKSFRAVRLLNELPTIVPGNITLDKIVRNNDLIVLSGSAPSDTVVSEFKQIIEKSPILSSPIVNQISSEKSSHRANFEINITQEDERK